MVDDQPVQMVVGEPVGIGVIARRAHQLVDLAANLDQLAARDAPHRLHRRFRLDQQPQLQARDILADIDVPDHVVAPLALVDETFALQPLHGLPKRSAGNLELFGEPLLHQLVAAAQLAPHDHPRKNSIGMSRHVGDGRRGGNANLA